MHVWIISVSGEKLVVGQLPVSVRVKASKYSLDVLRQKTSGKTIPKIQQQRIYLICLSLVHGAKAEVMEWNRHSKQFFL